MYGILFLQENTMVENYNIPENQFKQKTTKYLDGLAQTSDAIKKLYYYDKVNQNYELDPK